MFDVDLRDELLNLSKGAYNIDDINYRYTNIKKIIKCRTADKIALLNFLLLNQLINEDCYQELLKKAESDYRNSYLYLMGRCQI